jgi:hypothetical protein
VVIWLTLSAATDLVIAGVMVHYLRSRRTGIAQTEDIITKLVRCGSISLSKAVWALYWAHNLSSVTIQTGLITSVCAVVDLIVYLSLVRISSPALVIFIQPLFSDK